MKYTLLALASLLLGVTASALPIEAPTDAEVVKEQLPSYPLTTCPFSGNELGDGSMDVVAEGRLIRVCCADCAAAAKKDPSKAIAKIDAAVIAAQKPSYPLEVCPISGEKLGGMGDPIDVVVGTRLVRVCCKGCIKGVKKDPAKALEPINAALIAAQRETYPSDTCLISGEPLGGEMGEPIDFLYGTRLVRVCCKGCIKGFKKDPAAFFAKLDALKAKPKKG